MWFQFVLAPFILVFNFLKDWFNGFTISEILNRRLDWFMTHLMIFNLLTGFKPLFNFIKACFTKPIMFIISLFKPKKALNYYEKQYDEMITKQAQMELKNQNLKNKWAYKKKELEDKITTLEKRAGIVKKLPLEEIEEREEKKADE